MYYILTSSYYNEAVICTTSKQEEGGRRSSQGQGRRHNWSAVSSHQARIPERGCDKREDAPQKAHTCDPSLAKSFLRTSSLSSSISLVHVIVAPVIGVNGGDIAFAAACAATLHRASSASASFSLPSSSPTSPTSMPCSPSSAGGDTQSLTWARSMQMDLDDGSTRKQHLVGGNLPAMPAGENEVRLGVDSV